MTVPTAPSFSSSHCHGENTWLRMARELACCNPVTMSRDDCSGPSPRPSGRRGDRGRKSASIMASATPAPYVPGKSIYAPEEKGVPGLRHHSECPTVADVMIEAEDCLIYFVEPIPKLLTSDLWPKSLSKLMSPDKIKRLYKC